MKSPHKLLVLVCASVLLTSGSLLDIVPAEATTVNSAVTLTNGTPPAGAIVVSGQSQQALQTALNQARDQGTPTNKAVVWIPAGTYVITDFLRIHSNTKVVADSGATIRGSKLIVYSDIEGSGGYDGPHDIEIVGGVWDGGARSGQSTSNNSGFIIRHGKNITFDGVTVTNCVNHFINVSASTDVVIKNSTFKNQVRASKNDTEFNDNAPNEESVKVTEVIHLDFADNGEGGINKMDGTPAGKVLVENNTFENVISAVGNHRSISSLKHGAYKSKVGGLTVRGNRFINVWGNAITLVSMDNAVVENNSVEGTSSLFAVANDAKGVRIANNSGILSPIQFRGKSTGLLQNATVSGGEFTIHVSEASTLDLSSVTVSDSGHTNVTYIGSSRGTITKSTFRGAKRHGIRAGDSSVVTVQNSSVVGAGMDGIEFDNAGSGCKALNNIVIKAGRVGIGALAGTKNATITGNNVASIANYDHTSWQDLAAYSNSTGNVFKNNCVSGKGVWFVPGNTNQNNTASGCNSGQASAFTKTTWERLYGNHYFDTMDVIAGRGFNEKGKTVVVTTAAGFQDTLAANGIAGVYNAPILLTEPTKLTAQTKNRLKVLAPSRVVVAGGQYVVNDNVLQEIKATTGVEPERYWGNLASDTADALAYAGKGEWSGSAVVVTDVSYWDALSVGPYAYAKKAPIFYARDGKTLTTETLKAMKDLGITKVYIIGGPYAVATGVDNQVKNNGIRVERIYGQTMMNTSQKVAEFALSQGMSANNMGIATTNGYYDGLVAGPFLGKKNSVLVLTDSKDVSAVDGIYLGGKATSSINNAYVFGGPYAVKESVWNYIRSYNK